MSARVLCAAVLSGLLLLSVAAPLQNEFMEKRRQVEEARLNEANETLSDAERQKLLEEGIQLSQCRMCQSHSSIRVLVE